MQSSIFSGVISDGLISSREEEDTIMSSEESSSYVDDSELDLGLGLSLGRKDNSKAAAQYKASSSSSSTCVTRASNNGSCGVKRAAAEPSSPPGRSAVSSQVVGWPPIGNHRMNSLVNQTKTPAIEQLGSSIDICKSRNHDGNDSVAKKTSLFVKVNMDGTQIGRKVDLGAHSCYETLAHKLDDMFGPGVKGTNLGQEVVMDSTRHVKLLDGASGFVLTYEDKDGDWMLVGDVPWGMFLNTVRRLRIMRTSDANGIAPRPFDRSRSQLTKPM